MMSSTPATNRILETRLLYIGQAVSKDCRGSWNIKRKFLKEKRRTQTPTQDVQLVDTKDALEHDLVEARCDVVKRRPPKLPSRLD